MQNDINRQAEMLRSINEPHEALLSGRQPYFSNMSLEPPMSPRQLPQDDARRSSIYEAPRPSMIRPPPPVPQHLSISPRRFGSIGGANASPSYNRSPVPPPPPPPHPLSNVSSPPGSLPRRHTSADIRQVNGWPPQPNEGSSPYASAQSSSHWPSSPKPGPNQPDQHVRDMLASYQLGGSRRNSRQTSPPYAPENGPSSESMWNVGTHVGAPKWPRPDFQSAPPTRRSSMASNVHSLLNPADTAERADEDDPLADERKRKRIQ